MIIIETSVFTKRITDLMTDDDYRELQTALVLKPDMGAIIKGSGGLREVRWKLGSKGKSGGVRIIYYWVVDDSHIRMLHAYEKADQENLTADQLKALKDIVERWQ